jgi:hypothetical protein
MVRELRALDFVVRGADLHAYADSLVPDIKTGVDVSALSRSPAIASSLRICPTANRPPSAPIFCQSRPAMESAWRSWRTPSGARPQRAARPFTRMRSSLEKCGSRSGLSGLARRSRRRAIGSVGSSGRRSRARLAKIPFCASPVMREADCARSPNGAAVERRRALLHSNVLSDRKVAEADG